MNGYVVSRGGTFGTVVREWVSALTGKEMLLIRWGPLRWVTPVNKEDVKQLASSYEAVAWQEAKAWLERRHLQSARKKTK